MFAYSLQKIFQFRCQLGQFFIRRHSYSNSYTVSNIIQIKDSSDNIVNVKGWITGARKMKDLIFVDINDGSCAAKLQIVVPKYLKQKNITFGSSLEAEGKVKLNPINNQIEILAERVKVIGACDPTAGYPFAAHKSYADEYIRQFMHFRSRHSSFACIMRIRDAVTRSLHDVLGKTGFILVNTPILTTNDCEGAGEVFLVSPYSEKLRQDMRKDKVPLDEAYFNSKAYLTVSGQLHLEAAVRGLGKVYTFGPVFRAENSRSRLHLSEFYMLEAELGFSEDLNDVMDLTEKLVREAISKLLENCSDDLVVLGKHIDCDIESNLKKLQDSPSFTRLDYKDAVGILQENYSHISVPAPKFGETLSKEHELFLSQFMAQQCGQQFVFITNWPTALKPFYMKHNGDQVLAFDLLGSVVGEVCGGSVREPCPLTLERRILQLEGGDSLSKGLQWYLDIRRHGNCPTSGFGIGFERLLQCLLGIPNIKDTLPFPRWPHSLRM